MKKITAVLLTLVMAVSLMACSGNTQTSETESSHSQSGQAEATSAPENQKNNSEAEGDTAQTNAAAGDTEAGENKILVAFFSATNTTQGVAEQMADGLGADLYEIVPEEPYTDADLDYNDDNSRSTMEMNDPTVRPAISGSVENMEQYDLVFLGYPIWWGETPRIVSTFMESYDFSGKTIVPFCTSGGSGIGSSAENLADLTDGAEWIPGQRLDGGSSQDEIMEWVNSLGLDVTGE